MKDKIAKLTKSFLAVMMVAALAMTNASCDDTETTDSTKFIISYSGMTDIGPAMQGVISKPSYKGATPSNFAITHVTLNGNAFNDPCFSINEETGEISINSSKETPVGLYKISVSCMSNGSTFEFKDAVAVNFMKPVPDGITMEPASIIVKYGAIVDKGSEAELPTSQVKTDGDHISIKGYKIANVRKEEESVDNTDSKLFAISTTGELSITKGDNGIALGTYVLDLKLITGSVSETDEEGIFENAIAITVVSEPRLLAYNPAEDNMEEEIDGSKTTFTSQQAPTIFGSTEEMSYSIKSVSPEEKKDKFEIDPQTGIITVAEGHGFKKGDKYEVTVNVANKYAPEGVDFPKAFTLNVVGYIVPVSNLEYEEEYSVVQTKQMPDISPKGTVLGSDLRFTATIPEALKDYVTINEKTGILTTQNNAILPVTDKQDTEYVITVKASNSKNEATAIFKYKVIRNKYHIAYIRYGNNLDLTPAENYANQFRIKADGTIAALNDYLKNIKPETGIDDDINVKWTIKGLHQSGGTTIDSNGIITLAELTANKCGTVLVTASTTDPEGELSSTLTVPVFFQWTGKDDGTELFEMTPFAIRANPETGDVLDQPKITLSDFNPDKLVMDYRRSFNYYPITNEEGFVKGAPSEPTFLGYVWRNYFGNSSSYGSKDPLSYEKNLKGGLLDRNKVVACIAPTADKTTYEVVVNKTKWRNASGEYANGVLYGQITFSEDAATVSNGRKRFPMVIWFDTKFKK